MEETHMKTDDLIQAVRGARKILLDAGVDATVEIRFVKQGAVVDIRTCDPVVIEDGLYADYPVDEQPTKASDLDAITDETVSVERAVVAGPAPATETSVEDPPAEKEAAPLSDASAASSAAEAPVADAASDATPVVGNDPVVVPADPAPSSDSGAALAAAQEELASAQAILKGDQASGGATDVLAADQARVDAAQAALDALAPSAAASDPSPASVDSSATSDAASSADSGATSAAV
jgi:hypothetical protein